MLTLNLSHESRWVDLAGGVRIKVKPFSIHALEQTHRLPVGPASACKNRLMIIPSEK